MPQFEVLATDYDGTLARHGTVDAATLSAIEHVRASGRRVFLVTGREIDDLHLVFSRFDLFDLVVAENGAIIYYPTSRKVKLLHAPPAAEFIAELRVRGVIPLSVGHVIVASREPNEGKILDAIKKLGLALEIIFNKGSVMVLPSGINKATGLAAALQEQGLAPERTVGIGDAENDHAFLQLCGCGVAVSNALPALKAEADLVTQGSHGAGVAELADLLVSTDLAGIPRRERPQTVLHQHPGVLSGLRAEPGEPP